MKDSLQSMGAAYNDSRLASQRGSVVLRNGAETGGEIAPGVTKRTELSTTKWGAEHGKGNVKHNNAIEQELDWAESQGASDIKKNKRQIDVSGNKVNTGDGRRIHPDAAYTLENTRNNTNYVSRYQLDDIGELNRELDNWKGLNEADPNAVNSLRFRY